MTQIDLSADLHSLPKGLYRVNRVFFFDISVCTKIVNNIFSNYIKINTVQVV